MNLRYEKLKKYRRTAHRNVQINVEEALKGISKGKLNVIRSNTTQGTQQWIIDLFMILFEEIWNRFKRSTAL